MIISLRCKQLCGSAGGAEAAWRRLDELAPLGGAADAVLRAWRLPLHKQLPLAPAAWHPALLRSHVTAGSLELNYAAAVLSSDAMHAVRDVHTLSLDLFPTTVDGCNDRQVEERVRAAFASLHALRTLKVAWGRSSDTMELFASALSCLVSLTCLDLHNTFLTGTVALALAPPLARLSQLAHLDLRMRWSGIDDGAAAALAPALGCLTTLTFLDLSENGLGVASAAALAPALRRLSQLQHLNLREAFGGDDAAAALAPALSSLTALTFLDLSNNDLEPAGMRAVVPALGRLSQLARLNLEGSCLWDGSAPAALAARLRHLTALTEIHLGVTALGSDDGGVAALAAALARLPLLARLHFAFDEISGRGAAALAPALARLPLLAHLDLAHNEIGGGGAAALAPALARLPLLAHLNLGSNKIGDGGAAALAPALARLSLLAHLNLSENEFGDCSVPAALAPALARLPVLTHLDLSENKFGDGSVPHFAAALAGLSALTFVHFYLNDFSVAGKAQFRAVVPSVSFHLSRQNRRFRT